MGQPATLQLIPVQDCSGQMSVETVSSIDGFLALESEWLALEKQCSGAILFQSFHWCRNVLLSSDLPRELVVLVARIDGEVAAILPAKIIKKLRCKVLTGLAEPFQEFSDILVRPGTDLNLLRAPMRDALLQSGADYLHFGQVRDDSDLLSVLGDDLAPLGEKEAAPYVGLGEFANWDAYFSTVRSKTRKNIRNTRNKLDREAPVTTQFEVDGPLIEEVIERTYEGRNEWLEQKGLTSRAFSDKCFHSFLQRFNNPAESKVETVAMVLRHGEKSMSDQWGFIHNNRYYAYIANYNTDYSHVSPGKMQLQEVMRGLSDLKVSSAELMVPDLDYKMTWATGTMAVQDRMLAMNARGRFLARIWFGAVRPRAKQIYTHLPEGMRRILMSGLASFPVL